MQRSRRIAPVALGLALLVTASACGGTGEASDPAAAATSGDTVGITDFAFQPRTLTVKAGTAVTFTNQDGFAHTVTANDKSYDSESLHRGETFERVYDEPGTYEYLCAIHNSMTGMVTVE